MLRFDRRYVIPDRDNTARAHELCRVDLVSAFCAVDRMVRCINMGRRVNTPRDLRHARARSGGERLERRDLDPRIAFVYRRLGADRDRDVVDSAHLTTSNLLTNALSSF